MSEFSKAHLTAEDDFWGSIEGLGRDPLPGGPHLVGPVVQAIGVLLLDISRSLDIMADRDRRVGYQHPKDTAMATENAVRLDAVVGTIQEEAHVDYPTTAH